MGNHKTSCKQCVSTKYEKLHTNLSHAPVYRMQKSQKHSFWYQNFSNLLQVRITYNARCLFEHKNHNSSCKQCIFTTSMYFSPLSSVAKISTALFLVPKRTKTVTELFFSPSMILFQKVQCSHVPIAKSPKQWIVLLAIACVLYTYNHTYRLPKSFQSEKWPKSVNLPAR